YFKNLTASVFNRVGFNLTDFTGKARLGNPVAADWYLVSNTTSSASGTSSSGAASATASVTTSATASSTGAVVSPSSKSESAMTRVHTLFVIVALGAVGILLHLL